jgi:hypothetical protein
MKGSYGDQPTDRPKQRLQLHSSGQDARDRLVAPRHHIGLDAGGTALSLYPLRRREALRFWLSVSIVWWNYFPRAWHFCHSCQPLRSVKSAPSGGRDFCSSFWRSSSRWLRRRHFPSAFSRKQAVLGLALQWLPSSSCSCLSGASAGLRRPPITEQWRQTQCSPKPALIWLP